MMSRSEIAAEVKRLEPWFHCIDLGDGLVTKSQSAIGEPVEHPRPTWEKVKVCLPDDLSGKSVLDVGCNAGFYSIEMKRRGAARVLGIDSQRDLVRQAMFVRRTIGLEIVYRRMSVYDLDPRELGQFDITLALGLIYHCKHLVLALEKLFLVTRDLLILETAIYPPEKAPESFVYAEGGAEPTLHPLAYVENLPDAKEAFELSVIGYRQGRGSWPQVQIAQRNYFRMSTEYVEALAELRRSELVVLGLLMDAPEDSTTQTAQK